MANEILGTKNDFKNVLNKTTPEIKNFVNNFAIPVTNLANTSNNKQSLLSKACKDIKQSLCNAMDEFNKLVIPGYEAIVNEGTVLEKVNSVCSDLTISIVGGVVGGKVIKLGWKGFKTLANDLTLTLHPSRQIASIGNVKLNTNTLNRDINTFFKKHNSNNSNNRNNNRGSNNQHPNQDNEHLNQRVVLEYGKGEFWEALKTKRQEPRLIALSRNAKADIRMDNNGFFYKFDPMHKTFKIHLHKYQHLGSNKYKLIEEVNPVTGKCKIISGEIERW